MDASADIPPATLARKSQIGLPVLVLLWILSGVVLLQFVNRPVSRTQEARVLETAREMLGGSAQDWLVPHVNGQVRLQKPPLTYWLSAAGFKMFGVSEAAGRLPIVLLAWLTLAVAFLAGHWLAGTKCGLISAAVVLSSHYFLIFGRLAETDVAAMFFIAAAMLTIWRNLGIDGAAAGSLGGWTLTGLAIGLAALSKGPPAVYPLLFLLVMACLQRNWAALRRFVLSPGLILLLALGLSWFIYIRATHGAAVFWEEWETMSEGRDHKNSFVAYVPWLLVACLPWTGFMVGGIVLAIRRWKIDPVGRGLVIWMAVILLPLCIIGNKQNHYTLQLLPPVAILCAWLIARTLEGSADPRESRDVRRIFLATVAVSLLAAVAVPLVARKQTGAGMPADWWIMAAISGASLITFLFYWWSGMAAALAVYAASAAVLLSLLVGAWWPGLSAESSRSLADAIRQTGDGPYVFYGQRDSIPLCFALRRVIPICHTPEDLLARSQKDPSLLVIVQEGKKDNVIPPMPPGFIQVMSPRKLDGYTVKLWQRMGTRR